MDFKGVIIKESLKDLNILNDVKIIKSVTETVTKSHKTPWLSKWTILTVSISKENIDEFCEKLKNSLDDSHEWYVDLSNNRYDITIFHDSVIKKRVFKSIRCEE